MSDNNMREQETAAERASWVAAEDVERVPLGRTGVQISPLGIGTWSWGDRNVWGYGGQYGRSDLEAAFRRSLAAGVNFFDTAELYGGGVSETLLGDFVRQVDRDQLVIASKFLPYPWRWRRGSLVAALRRSLDRLRLIQVDLYQIHFPLPPRSTTTWAAALSDAVEAGMARAVGVSNYSARQMRHTHAVLEQYGVPLASNQVHYSLLQRKPERDGVLAACRELGITLIAYSPLEMGLLTGKYTPEHPPAGVRGRRYSRKYLASLAPLLACLREIGEAHGGKTPVQVALNWTIAKGAVPIPGAKDAHQAEMNAGALGWRLTDEEVAILDAASEGVQAGRW